MNNKVYALVEQDFYYGEQHYSEELFYTKDDAIKRLNVLRQCFKNNNDMDDYIIDADIEDEFDCYLDGWYLNDRYILYITEKEIK